MIGLINQIWQQLPFGVADVERFYLQVPVIQNPIPLTILNSLQDALDCRRSLCAKKAPKTWNFMSNPFPWQYKHAYLSKLIRGANLFCY